jgi:hypothetical protein
MLWLVALVVLDLVMLALWLHYMHPGRASALLASLRRPLFARERTAHRSKNRPTKSKHLRPDGPQDVIIRPASQPSPPTRAEAVVSVPEAVDQLLKLCLRTVPVEAAVVLLPYQNMWCVAGGVSLGDRERTLRLGPDNWLLNQVAVARRGVIIENTDAFRAQLAFTPLAHWRTLLAVSLPSVYGLLAVARAKEPFTPKELRALARTAVRGAGALTDAVQDAREIDLTGPRQLIDP